MGRRLLAGLVAGAVLVVGAACGGDGDDGEARASTTAPEASSEPAAETTDETSTTVEATTTTLAELTNAVVEERMADAHPDEAALVDWTIFRWVYGFGYTATVPEGTTAEQGVAVCEGLAKVLDAHGSEDAVAVVAGPGEADLAGRATPADACAPGGISR